MTILAFGALLVASCTAQKTQRLIQPEQKSSAPTKNELLITTIAAAASKGGQGSPVYTKLIAPTIAEERRKQVVSGGRDPFASLLVSPIIIDDRGIIKEKPPLPPTLPVESDPQQNKQPHQIAIALTTEPGPVEAPEVKSLASLPKMPPLPPIQTARLPILTTPSLPPEARSAVTALGTGSAAGTSRTEIAEAVKVSGVMELGSGKKAIVQVPGEKTHRYVEAGEWLGQGKVQVKRIEFSDGGVPVVIVSENGQEVVKMVGSSRNSIAGSFGWTN